MSFFDFIEIKNENANGYINLVVEPNKTPNFYFECIDESADSVTYEYFYSLSRIGSQINLYTITVGDSKVFCINTGLKYAV